MNTEQIWKNFHDQLLSFIESKVQDSELAKDLLQEVYVKIHLKLPTLKSTDALASWIYTITRNVIIDHYRRSKTEVKVKDEFQYSYDEVDNEEFCEECLHPLIDKLPAEFKEAILATDLGSLTQKEYAQEIGLSYSGLKSRVQRGRQQLNSLFEDCCSQRDICISSENTLPCGCPA